MKKLLNFLFGRKVLTVKDRVDGTEAKDHPDGRCEGFFGTVGYKRKRLWFFTDQGLGFVLTTVDGKVVDSDGGMVFIRGALTIEQAISGWQTVKRVQKFQKLLNEKQGDTSCQTPIS